MVPAKHTRRAAVAAAVAGIVAPGASFAQRHDPNDQTPTSMRLRMTFDRHVMVAVLYDNPSARDLFSMPPLDLEISDFGGNEKIAHLPRKLTEEGSGPFGDEKPYDLCYYKPWGNLAMFHAGYRHTDLIRLGRFVEGERALHVKGVFRLRVERG